MRWDALRLGWLWQRQGCRGGLFLAVYASLVALVVAGGGGALWSSIFMLLPVVAVLLIGYRAVFPSAGMAVVTGGALLIVKAFIGIGEISHAALLAWGIYSAVTVGAAVGLYFLGRQLVQARAREAEVEQRMKAADEAWEKQLERRVHQLERPLRYLSVVQAAVEGAEGVKGDLDSVAWEIVGVLEAHFEVLQVALFVRDVGGKWMVLRAASGDRGKRLLQERYRVRVGQMGRVGYVARFGKLWLVERRREAREVWNILDRPDARSAVTLPLRLGGEIIGVLDMQSAEEGAFAEADKPLLRVLAAYVAAVIGYAWAREMSGTSGMAEDEAERDRWLALLRADLELGYLSDARGIRPVVGEWLSVMDEARRRGEVLYVEEEGAPTVLIPVIGREGTLGVIRLRKPQGAEAWTEEEVELVRALTDQMSQALEGAWLYRQSQQLAAQERLVSEVTARIRETLMVDTVLETAAREMRRVLDLEEAEVRIGVWKMEEAGGAVPGVAGAGHE